jgi:CRISPR-associated protein Csy1
MNDSDHFQAKSLRESIEKFIQDRLKLKIEEQQKKLKKETSQNDIDAIEEKISSLITEYRREDWLRDAAKRAPQIKVATHIPKFTHPMAKASAINFQSSSAVCNNLVSSLSVREQYQDVTGNAAALDVFAFLNLKYGEEKILDMVSRKSSVLASAMCDSVEEGYELIDSFLSISELSSPTSHTLMKQVYFPIDDGSYHLLSPVFPSSLVNEVHEIVKDKRFSDEAKAARTARKDNHLHETGFTDFYDLANIYYGGTKPQNISQLNSNRGGAGVLFASVPPNWRSKSLNAVNAESVFANRFGNRLTVKELLDMVLELAKSNYDNFHIREGLKKLVKAMSYELADLSYEMLELPAGWSNSPNCRLNYYEKLWLDPFTTAEGSREAYIEGKWCREVAKRFARWLANQIKDKHNDAVIIDQDVWTDIAEYVLDDVRRSNREEQ